MTNKRDFIVFVFEKSISDCQKISQKQSLKMKGDGENGCLPDSHNSGYFQLFLKLLGSLTNEVVC